MRVGGAGQSGGRGSNLTRYLLARAVLGVADRQHGKDAVTRPGSCRGRGLKAVKHSLGVGDQLLGGRQLVIFGGRHWRVGSGPSGVGRLRRKSAPSRFRLPRPCHGTRIWDRILRGSGS